MKMTKKVKRSAETLVLERKGFHPAIVVSDLDREEKFLLQGNPILKAFKPERSFRVTASPFFTSTAIKQFFS